MTEVQANPIPPATLKGNLRGIAITLITLAIGVGIVWSLPPFTAEQTIRRIRYEYHHMESYRDEGTYTVTSKMLGFPVKASGRHSLVFDESRGYNMIAEEEFGVLTSQVLHTWSDGKNHFVSTRDVKASEGEGVWNPGLYELHIVHALLAERGQPSANSKWKGTWKFLEPEEVDGATCRQLGQYRSKEDEAKPGLRLWIDDNYLIRKSRQPIQINGKRETVEMFFHPAVNEPVADEELVPDLSQTGVEI